MLLHKAIPHPVESFTYRIVKLNVPNKGNRDFGGGEGEC